MRHIIISIIKARILLIHGRKSPSSQAKILNPLKKLALKICWQLSLIGIVAISGCSSELFGRSEQSSTAKKRKAPLPNLPTRKSAKRPGMALDFKAKRPPMARPSTKKI